MLVRDVFVATGGPRGLFKPKVGEVYQVMTERRRESLRTVPAWVMGVGR